MKWNQSIRQLHRWLPIIFTVIVVALIATFSLGTTPPEWVYYAPLLPLALMVLSGLYMFVLPYIAKRGRPQGSFAGNE